MTSAPSLAGDVQIEARGVRVSLGDAAVLRGVDLRVTRGQMMALIGPNGSGKTTLLRALLGLQPITEGEIRLFGGPVGPETLKRVGYVPQRLTLDAGLAITVGEFLSLKSARLPRAQIRAAAAEVGADRWLDRPLAGLSGGQRQRALIAFSLIGNPEILLLDEPTAGVDTPGETTFYEMISEARRRRSLTVVLVSHDLSMVHRQADWVCALNGIVCCEGPPEKVINTEALQRAYGLDVAPYHHHHVHGHPVH